MAIKTVCLKRGAWGQGSRSPLSPPGGSKQPRMRDGQTSGRRADLWERSNIALCLSTSFVLFPEPRAFALIGQAQRRRQSLTRRQRAPSPPQRPSRSPSTQALPFWSGTSGGRRCARPPAVRGPVGAPGEGERCGGGGRRSPAQAGTSESVMEKGCCQQSRGSRHRGERRLDVRGRGLHLAAAEQLHTAT